MQANNERFQNRRLREREREISNIPRGIVISSRITMDTNFPDTLPPTPYRDDFFPQPPNTPCERSFLFPESLSPLRNRLPNMALLPSRPSINKFLMIKLILSEVTPKKPTPDINKTNLSG